MTAAIFSSFRVSPLQNQDVHDTATPGRANSEGQPPGTLGDPPIGSIWPIMDAVQTPCFRQFGRATRAKTSDGCFRPSQSAGLIRLLLAARPSWHRTSRFSLRLGFAAETKANPVKESNFHPGLSGEYERSLSPPWSVSGDRSFSLTLEGPMVSSGSDFHAPWG